MYGILLKISFLLSLSLSLAHVFHIDNTTGANNTLEERQLLGHQFMCCMGHCSYELVGDGDPHTDYLHRQMTSTGECRDGPGAKGCGIGFSASHTFGYTVSAGANIGWFAPGFSVTESWTVGEIKTCSADINATVCLWYDMAYVSSAPFRSCELVILTHRDRPRTQYKSSIGTCRARCVLTSRQDRECLVSFYRSCPFTDQVD